MWLKAALTASVAMALLAWAVPISAQQTGTINGTVTEAGSGRPLAGAQVTLQGVGAAGLGGPVRVAQAGITTNQDGRYTLANVPVGPVRVRVRLVGYTSLSATTELTAGQTAEVNFELSASVISLDEIVVTGAGVAQSKKQLGNTIVTVNAADLARTQSLQNFSETIGAREPGVLVQPTGGVAGESARIRIRGTASMSQGNNPVVYLDGVRIDGGRSLSYGSSGGGGRARAFDNINPESIERIEVLKGAAAATLYGSEANNGVIQIFTKKGSAGAPRFNFKIDQGVSMMDKGRIKANTGFARTAEQLTNMQNIFGAPNLQLYEPLETNILADRYGSGYSYGFSGDVAGGTDDFQYFVAGRWTREDGPIKEDLGPGGRDTIRRIQGSAQFTLFPRDRLSFRFSTMFTDSFQESPPNNNNIYGYISSATMGKPEHANCDESSFGSGNGTCTGAGNPGGARSFATTAETAQRFLEGTVEHFNASVTGTYQAAQSINVDVTFGVDATNDNSFDFRPFANDIDNFTNVADQGSRNRGSRNHRELTVDARSTWTERFGNISSQLVVGGQGFISRNKTVSGNGTQFPGPGLETLGALANFSVGEGFSEQVNIGLLFQEQIGLNDWIYLTGGGRWDRNSAFGDSTNGQFYPKVSVSIIPSDLGSWNSTFLSSFRVRGAFGKSGQQPGAFDRFTTFSALAASTGAGLQPANLGNIGLKPEVSREIELGADLGLFNNRLGLDATYWIRETQDALVERQFPFSGGFFNTQLDNIGLINANGLEIKATALVIDNENLTLDLFANGAYLQEEIRSMGGAPPIKVAGSYSRVRNFLRGPDTLGTGEVIYYAPGIHMGAKLIEHCSNSPTYMGNNALFGTARPCWIPGSTLPFDTNGDGQPDTIAEFTQYLQDNIDALSLDMSAFGSGIMMDDIDGDGDVLDNPLGKPTPDWAGAFGANITLWRNLQVNALFEYKTGDYWINNLTDGFRNAHPLIGRNTPHAAELEAQFINPATSIDEKIAAALEYVTELKALSPHSGLNMIKKGDFVRFRELGVTYTAPQSFASVFGLDNLQFNVSGRNLLIWTGYDGIDPELNDGNADDFYAGIEAFGTGIPRRFNFSVRFGF
jgi:TonB-linked SusC/RagA family outer membrane protein